MDLSSCFAGRRVLVTGHSGFKGGWLTLWLTRLGAEVVGVALPPDQGPDNLFDRAAIAGLCDSRLLDIRDYGAVEAVFRESRPEVVFHLAAQPLVRRSYRDPLATFATNVMGTAHVLEAARLTPSVRAVVCVTTDKVYDNKEWHWPYREEDGLGGKDPYSASKSAAELVARSYATVLRSEPGYLLATARGGNVVGGGDWSEDRIVPDIVRALRAGEPLVLRNPGAIRPWQHVLELCHGYLLLGARLIEGWPERAMAAETFTGAFNFGPDGALEMPVSELVAEILAAWNAPGHPVRLEPSAVHESRHLKLDSSKARAVLGWRPHLDFKETIHWTADWYRRYVRESADAGVAMEDQLAAYRERLTGAARWP